MSDGIMAELEASVQAKIAADNDFQTSLADLSDDEKAQKLDERKSEEFNRELSTLKEGSEKAAKAQELADNYKVRAEKAEAKLKEGAPLTAKQEDGLSNKDILFLAKADIHEDDMDEVLDWAKFKKVAVSEAYKQMKDVLDVRTEQRKTAQATQTRGGARGASKVSGEDLLSKAEKTGEVPTTDEGMSELFLARQARRHGKKK